MNSSVEKEFKKEFLKLVKERGLQIPMEWEAPFPEFMPVVAKFVSADGGRIFTVEGSSDFEFACDYAIRKTGEDFEQFDLLLKFQDACSNFELILEIYRRWFIDLYSVQEIENYLSGVCE